LVPKKFGSLDVNIAFGSTKPDKVIYPPSTNFVIGYNTSGYIHVMRILPTEKGMEVVLVVDHSDSKLVHEPRVYLYKQGHSVVAYVLKEETVELPTMPAIPPKISYYLNMHVISDSGPEAFWSSEVLLSFPLQTFVHSNMFILESSFKAFLLLAKPYAINTLYQSKMNSIQIQPLNRTLNGSEMAVPNWLELPFIVGKICRILVSRSKSVVLLTDQGYVYALGITQDHYYPSSSNSQNEDTVSHFRHNQYAMKKLAHLSKYPQSTVHNPIYPDMAFIYKHHILFFAFDDNQKMACVGKVDANPHSRFLPSKNNNDPDWKDYDGLLEIVHVAGCYHISVLSDNFFDYNEDASSISRLFYSLSSFQLVASSLDAEKLVYFSNNFMIKYFSNDPSLVTCVFLTSSDQLK
jgi:hypothetical protein